MKGIAFSVLVVLVHLSTFAQKSDIGESKTYSPNFLVHNQLTPEFLKLEYVAGISKGTVENDNQAKNYLKQNTLTISGYPLNLVNKRHQQLYLGFGYTQDKYSEGSSEALNTLSENTLHSLNVNVFLNTRIRQQLYWFSYLQVGSQGTSPFSDVDKSHNEIFLNKINYKVNRNMNVGAGLAYMSNLGKPLILPSIAFVYSTDHYLINVDFPVKTEIEGILKNGKWRPVVGVSFPGNTYHVNSVNEYFSTTGLTGYVGMRYRVLDFMYVHAAWQTGIGETFKYGDRSDRKEIGTFAGQNRLLISVNFQMARIIPKGED